MCCQPLQPNMDQFQMDQLWEVPQARWKRRQGFGSVRGLELNGAGSEILKQKSDRTDIVPQYVYV